MTDATMTPLSGGNDSAQPSISLEDASNLDFYDPGDEQETVEVAGDGHSEIEPDEAAEGQETDKIEASGDDDDVAEDAEQGEQGSTPEPGDDATVTIDGQKLTIAELKKGYYREADYTRQKQRVSQKEQELEALSARVHQSVEAIVDHLTKQIPPAPDPKLAYTNPTAFVQQKAMHEAAVAEVEALLSQVNGPKEVQQQLSQEKLSEIREAELAALAEKFPMTRSKEGFDQFFQTAAAAAKDLGYTDAEIQSALDHRLFALSYYASLGMKAEQAKQKAKAKVQSVPPVAPQKAANQGVRASVARRNQEAMKRLAKTGSIHDALAIDFD